jgi:hypothetical protein
MDNLQLKLFRLGAKLVAPQSISAQERKLEDGGGYFPEEYLQFVERRRCVRAGDLIVLHTPGRTYNALRKVAAQGDYDHLGVVTEGGMFLHVGPPKVGRNSHSLECMYVCVCVYMYVCVCVFFNAFVNMYVYLFLVYAFSSYAR